MKFQNITHDDMNNGDGLRVVLWVSGCSHHCPECQNPITWDPDDGVPFTLDAYGELFEDLKKDHVSGITFSGGDPLHPNNRSAVSEAVSTIKHVFPQKTVWLYTGYTWEEIVADRELSDAVRLVDVLVDGRFVPELKDTNYPWAGSTNQRVIDVQKTLSEGRVVLHASN